VFRVMSRAQIPFHPEETMPSLLTQLFRRPQRAEHLTFTLYTRAECCCCHKARDVLTDAQQRFGFAIEEVDVDSDPDLVAQFDTEVPVVAFDGKVRFRGVVNPALLDRLLLAEIPKRPASDMLPPEGE
jgi:glutaredoxin